MLVRKSSAFRLLPYEVSVHAVADRCREAAFELLAGTSAAWTQKELTRWLLGAYRHATAATASSSHVLRAAENVESAAASEQLSGQAAQLKDAVAAFTIKMASKTPALKAGSGAPGAKRLAPAQAAAATAKVSLDDVNYGKN
jgi:hypothetical protein